MGTLLADNAIRAKSVALHVFEDAGHLFSNE